MAVVVVVVVGASTLLSSTLTRMAGSGRWRGSGRGVGIIAFHHATSIPAVVEEGVALPLEVGEVGLCPLPMTASSAPSLPLTTRLTPLPRFPLTAFEALTLLTTAHRRPSQCSSPLLPHLRPSPSPLPSILPPPLLPLHGLLSPSSLRPLSLSPLLFPLRPPSPLWSLSP